MPQIIPFRPSEANYEFDVAIDGVTYTFDVHWNSREEAWYFHIFQPSDVVLGLYPVVCNVKVVLGTYLGRRTHHPLFQNGLLLCRVSQGDDLSEPRFDDMGTRVQVLYFTREDAAQQIMSTIHE